MRSLVFTLNSPAPHNGGAALRNLQTIRSLAGLGPVDLVILGATGDGRVHDSDHEHSWTLERLAAERNRAERLWGRAWCLRPRGHWRLAMYRSSAALGAVRALVDETRPDLVVASQWPTGEYALAVAGERRLVFDTHNVETDLRGAIGEDTGGRLASVASRVAIARLRAWEARLGRAADQVWVCSSEDARVWSGVHGAIGTLRVVPNTVRIDLEPRWGDIARDPHRIILTGTFSYRPNTDAAWELIHQVLPMVRSEVRDANVQLVGRKPTQELLAHHNPSEGIQVIGAVPDIVPYLAAASVMVIPLRAGGGTRLKILEAMATGLPVVTTRKGTEGLEVTDGEHLLIGSTSAELAEAAVRIMVESETAERISAAARRLVEDRYSSATLDRMVAAAAAAMKLT